MFIPLLLRGKSPAKTKRCITEIFSGCVVTYRTRRKFLLRVREFLFHKTYLHLPLSWFHFFFVSFTEHGQPQQLFVQKLTDVNTFPFKKLVISYRQYANSYSSDITLTQIGRVTLQKRPNY
jgi:hypothetical protein